MELPPKKFCDYYDLIYKNKNYEKEIDFYYEFYKKYRKSWFQDKILDFGCGTGNHTEFLSKRFENVYGLDIDQNMIDIAQNKKFENKVDFTVSKIKDFQGKDFTFCIALFNIFTFIPSLKSLISEFTEINKRMVDRGVFVFDVWNGLAAVLEEPRPYENRKYDFKDNSIMHRHIFSMVDKFRQEIHINNSFDLIKNKKIIDKFNYDYIQYLWTPKILIEALNMSCFRVEEVGRVEDFTKGASEKDWRIYFVCRKIDMNKFKKI